jgi:hypothetical protein
MSPNSPSAQEAELLAIVRESRAAVIAHPALSGEKASHQPRCYVRRDGGKVTRL